MSDGAVLNVDDVIGYLLSRGELSPAELVRTDFWVEQLDRKNISFVLHTGRPELLLKRPRDPRDVGIAAEAAIYRALQGTGVAAYLPPLRFFDPARQLLALGYLPDSVTLREYHRQTGRAPAYVGRAAGRMLSTLHQVMDEAAWHADGEQLPPWALTLLHPPISVLETESTGTLEVLRRIQADRAGMRVLETLLDGWTTSVLCHHDVRLDNLLLVRSSDRSRCLAVVDWELCGPGNGLWDVAGLLAGYVELWATHALGAHRPGAAAPPTGSRRGIGSYQKLLLAFWQAYTSGLPADRWTGSAPVLQTAQCVSARLMQAALEYSQRSNDVTQESLALLQIAQYFAAYPFESWVHVLGLPLTGQMGSIHA